MSCGKGSSQCHHGLALRLAALLLLLLLLVAGSPRGCSSTRVGTSLAVADVGGAPKLRALRGLRGNDAGATSVEVGPSGGSGGPGPGVAAAIPLLTAAAANEPAEAMGQAQPQLPPPLQTAALPVPPPPDGVATAHDCAELFALLRNSSIRIAGDLCMAQQAAAGTAAPSRVEVVVLRRNVSVVGAALAAAEGLLPPFSPAGINIGRQLGSSSADGSRGGGSTAGNSSIGGSGDLPPPLDSAAPLLLNLTRLDFAFLPARIQLQPGAVLTLRGLELWRGLTRLSAHLDFMAASPAPGVGRVVIESCVQHRVSCLSLPKAEENYRSLPRADEPAAGTGSSSNSSGAPPGQEEEEQEVELRASPPVCWFNTECSPEAGGSGSNSSSSVGAPKGPQPPQATAAQQVATWVAPPPEVAAAAAAAGVAAGLVQCRSPYLNLRDVSYTTQILDSTFLNNGGYIVTYVRSLWVCDWPVPDACVDVRGAERCVAEALAAHSDDYYAGGPSPAWAAAGDQAAAVQPPGAAAAAPPAEGGDGGGGSSRGLALGLGLGLGGALLVSVAGFAAWRLWRRQRRRRWQYQQQRREPAAAGAGGSAVAGTPGGSSLELGSSLALPRSPEPHGAAAPGAMMSGGCGSSGSKVLQTAGGGGIGGSRPSGSDSRYGGGVTTTGTPSSAERAMGAEGEAAQQEGGDELGGASGGGQQCSRLPPGPRRSLGGRSGGRSERRTSCSALTRQPSPAATELTAHMLFGGGEPSRVEALRRQLAASRQTVSVQVLEPIGQGSFARVYKGIWQGSVVALKVLLLPASLSRDERLQHIAVMEAAVSSGLSHPNLVQTFSYSFRALYDSTAAATAATSNSGSVPSRRRRDDQLPDPPALPAGESGAGEGEPLEAEATAGGAEAQPHGYELQLVLEYCDLGTLRQALDRGVFHRNMQQAAAAGGGGGVGGGVGGGAAAEGRTRIPPAAPAAEATTAAAAAAGAVRSAGGGCGGGAGAGTASPGPRGADGAGAAAVRSAGSTIAAHMLQVMSGAGGSAGEGMGVPLQRLRQQLLQPQPPRRSYSAGGSPPPPDIRPPAPAYRYGLMLSVACDVASALLHLHSHNIVHGDVKASNVLLKSGAGGSRALATCGSSGGASGTPTLLRNTSGGGGAAGPAAAADVATAAALSPTPLKAGAVAAVAAAPAAVNTSGGPQQLPSSSLGGQQASGFRGSTFERLLTSGMVAKVGDFGLATHMDDERHETHISALTAQGTLSHMAPELLLHGHISKHCDTFAFGILLFELFSGERAHRGVPRALLPHAVALRGLRPVLPPHTPPDYRALAERCWQSEPRQRPTFQEILEELHRMRHAAESEATVEAAEERGWSAAAGAAAGAGSGGATAATTATAAAGDGGGGALRWVEVPRLEATTCDTALFAAMVASTAENTALD
ncbi:hypothetical protein HXX76_004388 [Chlamydomonas incerta]|uniref:Protein kinase domain-containing protein n=1 Tax=Chlamydomonas incerta TaxID=51695 RepID=A0A835W8T6_CHLIN|nr:hypothetical protein HXX76_004388 [Chlamydomonas incerta]|eukprot:KAG2440276.1 hypothetical protein HXX76_004388 [Chlamydomonas incerta]